MEPRPVQHKHARLDLVPSADELRQPLGIGVVGGLLLSLVLTLYRQL